MVRFLGEVRDRDRDSDSLSTVSQNSNVSTEPGAGSKTKLLDSHYNPVTRLVTLFLEQTTTNDQGQAQKERLNHTFTLNTISYVSSDGQSHEISGYSRNTRVSKLVRDFFNSLSSTDNIDFLDANGESNRCHFELNKSGRFNYKVNSNSRLLNETNVMLSSGSIEENFFKEQNWSEIDTHFKPDENQSVNFDTSLYLHKSFSDGFTHDMKKLLDPSSNFEQSRFDYNNYTDKLRSLRAEMVLMKEKLKEVVLAARRKLSTEHELLTKEQVSQLSQYQKFIERQYIPFIDQTIAFCTEKPKRIKEILNYIDKYQLKEQKHLIGAVQSLELYNLWLNLPIQKVSTQDFEAAYSVRFDQESIEDKLKVVNRQRKPDFEETFQKAYKELHPEFALEVQSLGVESLNQTEALEAIKGGIIGEIVTDLLEGDINLKSNVIDLQDRLKKSLKKDPIYLRHKNVLSNEDTQELDRFITISLDYTIKLLKVKNEHIDGGSLEEKIAQIEPMDEADLEERYSKALQGVILGNQEHEDLE